MKHQQLKKSQQGMALVAALLVIIIFAVMGMMNAQKAKDSEKLAGGSVRYGIVFEAAERTLRDAVNYISHINGTPMAGSVSATTINNFNTKGFDTTNISQAALQANPKKSIVWDRSKLAKKVCGTENCAVQFAKRLDDEVWAKRALKTTFTNDTNVSAKNYLKDTETYTVIEALKNAGGVSEPTFGESRMQESSSGGIANKMSYYLLTVKASGFPPGETDRSAAKSRENVIVQAVFAKR